MPEQIDYEPRQGPAPQTIEWTNRMIADAVICLGGSALALAGLEIHQTALAATGAVTYGGGFIDYTLGIMNQHPGQHPYRYIFPFSLLFRNHTK